MRPAHTRSESGGAEPERIGLRGRNSKKTNRKRIAARRSDRLHQSTHDPVASLAIAFANAERAQSAARERAGARLTLHPVGVRTRASMTFVIPSECEESRSRRFDHTIFRA